MSPNLTEEQWRRLAELFAIACEMAPDRQVAFARESLADDSELLSHLLGMLRHSGTAAARITGAIAGIMKDAADAGPHDRD